MNPHIETMFHSNFTHTFISKDVTLDGEGPGKTPLSFGVSSATPTAIIAQPDAERKADAKSLIYKQRRYLGR